MRRLSKKFLTPELQNTLRTLGLGFSCMLLSFGCGRSLDDSEAEDESGTGTGESGASADDIGETASDDNDQENEETAEDPEDGQEEAEESSNESSDSESGETTDVFNCMAACEVVLECGEDYESIEECTVDCIESIAAESESCQDAMSELNICTADLDCLAYALLEVQVENTPLPVLPCFDEVQGINEECEFEEEDSEEESSEDGETEGGDADDGEEDGEEAESACVDVCQTRVDCKLPESPVFASVDACIEICEAEVESLSDQCRFVHEGMLNCLGGLECEDLVDAENHLNGEEVELFSACYVEIEVQKLACGDGDEDGETGGEEMGMEEEMKEPIVEDPISEFLKGSCEGRCEKNQECKGVFSRFEDVDACTNDCKADMSGQNAPCKLTFTALNVCMDDLSCIEYLAVETLQLDGEASPIAPCFPQSTGYNLFCETE